MREPKPPVQVAYRIRVTPRLVWLIVAPYVYRKLVEQIKAMAPISLFLLAFQFLVFRLLSIEHPLGVAAGMCCVVIGLAFFTDGLPVGVMPLGENIGATMPAKAHLWLILVVACVLGTTANMAEGAISTAGLNVFTLIGQNFVAAAQAIIPLSAILLIAQRVVLRERVSSVEQVVAGILFALVGLLLFKIGLEQGLTPLGDQVCRSSIISFTREGFAFLAPGLAPDGRYGPFWGKAVVLLFGFVAGYGATLAEPARRRPRSSTAAVRAFARGSEFWVWRFNRRRRSSSSCWRSGSSTRYCPPWSRPASWTSRA